MDSYLSPHQQDVVNPKMLCRDGGALMLEPPFSEDFASPYSVNMSLLLPDVTYLRPGLCRTVRQIKTEPPHSLMHAACQGNGAAGPPALQEYPGVYGTADAAGGNFFIKQEVPDFQDVPLFQLLNSDLEQLVHGSQLNSIPMPPLSLPIGHVHAQNSAKPASSPQNECFRQHAGHQQRPTYLPPSPPNSEPSSPDRGKELLLSPPPSYEASIASKLTFQTRNNPVDPGQTSSAAPIQSQDQSSSGGLVQSPGPVHVQRPTLTPVQTSAGVGPLSPVLAQSALFKNNRRNNPDLERRRIHHCDVPGERCF